MKILILFLFSINTQALAAKTENTSLITSFSVLQNLVKQIAPEDIQVKALVPLDSDPHDYKLSIQDVIKLKKIHMYFYFGHGVDDHLITNQEIQNKCRVSSNLNLIQDKSKNVDPHAWQDPMMGVQMAQNILSCLNQIFPDQKKQMQKNFDRLSAELKKISTDYKKQFQSLPSESKKIVTAHMAFRYLEGPFQLQIFSIQGLHSHSEPSARSLQNLVDQINTHKVGYLFPEKTEVSSTFKRLQSLTTIKLGPRLYSDTLSSESGPASSYQNLVRHNLESIYQALKTKDNL